MQLDDYHCPFCSCHEEEASHIFFGCQRIMPLWWESLAWTEVVTVFLASPRDPESSICGARRSGSLRLGFPTPEL